MDMMQRTDLDWFRDCGVLADVANFIGYETNL